MTVINKVSFSVDSKITPLSKHKQVKTTISTKINNIENSENIFAQEKINKNEVMKHLSDKHAVNYVYLGSTNMPTLNSMGLTLEDDGSLLLIKGESYDLFKGLYQKHFNGGFSYDVFKITSNKENDIKFQDLYINLDGDLIGRVREDTQAINGEENKPVNGEAEKYYKITFKDVKKEYEVKNNELNSKNKNMLGQFVVDYEAYDVSEDIEKETVIVKETQEKTEENKTDSLVDLNENSGEVFDESKELIDKNSEKKDSINIEEIDPSIDGKDKERIDKVLVIKRNTLDVRIKLVDNEILVAGLTGTIASECDQTDGPANSSTPWKYSKIKLPLKDNEKILSIKKVLNQIQVVVDKGKRTKIYYLNPLNIFAVEEYKYEVKRLKQEPPLSFYSKVGENNYKKYHTGQPFTTQTVGNFSSQHIPFFSSMIDNGRIHWEIVKQKWALGERKSMAVNIAKSVDPGLRGGISNIKSIFNTLTAPSETRVIAYESGKHNLPRSGNVIAKHVVGVQNGKTHGEIIYSLVKRLKESESIATNHTNGVNLFFGMSAFSLPQNVGINAFILANYAKTHSITLTKNKDDKVTFSFMNKVGMDITAGLSAGVGEYNKRWGGDSVDYGIVTPMTASLHLTTNYEKKSNFSFTIELDELTDFINRNMKDNNPQSNQVDNIIKGDSDQKDSELVQKSSLELNTNVGVSLAADFRSEVSFDVNVHLTDSRGITIPRNAAGFSAIAKLLNLNYNINKFMGYGSDSEDSVKKTVELQLLELGFDIYADLKFAPSASRFDKDILWYPLATVRTFKSLFKRKINAFFSTEIFNSKKVDEDKILKEKVMHVKGIYKRILKINRLFELFPSTRKHTDVINSLDDVYLTLSSGRFLKDKLLNKDELIYEGDEIKNDAGIISKDENIQQLLLDLKERKKYLSSQIKNNMNEVFKPYFVSEYKLSQEDDEIIAEKKNKIGEIIRGIDSKYKKKKNGEKEYDFEEIKKQLDDIYHECKDKLNKMEYHLDNINIMSVSELADKSKSLPLIFLRLESQSKVIHHQLKGVINFQYEEADKEKNKVPMKNTEEAIDIDNGKQPKDHKAYDYKKLSKVATSYYF